MTNQRNLRRDFASREELIAYVREQFPAATKVDDHVSTTIGGRKAAKKQLRTIQPGQYAKSRNFMNGAVTRLSAYIRYGVLGLAEVRDTALRRARNKSETQKFINELGWRDYWQRLYAQMGDGIWQDREPYKTGYSARSYANELPEDIREGSTGLRCIDAFSQELRETGYLHNHARMWIAAYVVHWRRVRWQAGARWFLEHLLDGDPASNNLSWQWVASTLSHKPYFFNRDNLERYTDAVYCRDCPLAGRCDFEGNYDELTQKLFPHKTD
ncbi:MAG: deoxyribodipyrimidine photo-lyase [Chloroflexi bacterium AL-W]|nr:deoxyribodipyrimidine photo-lyase [Chloroflexi bacterium AL-N1]NOK68296.1 deoxyribodipyrimidine photo-lyase [Chloroflexi bacterium AL-N10]NOK73942.1 deoxyribodipyrimidine photo-lyase [Chloroflexi bacterium AL-N5]NOK82910.1 deoxyribodipyrimidine photo-lyase [Chloroflexi bacterium AL-W]NOK90432.1 deoxyribodipyrimidine photo-lyase [Chloroflexi bacterium AL-N15]